MSVRPLIVSVAALLLWVPSAGAAAPGTPDPAFGVNGIGGGALGPAYEEAAFEDLRIEDDGTLRVNSESLKATYRFLPDGSVDPASPQPLPPAQVEATQADGKVLVVDAEGDGIRRLNPDGSADRSFNGGVSEPFLADFSRQVIVPLASGQILVAGEETRITGTKESETLGRLGRLNADGTVDRDFGDGGSIAVPAYGELIDVIPTPAGGGYLVFSRGIVKVGYRGTAPPAFGSHSASGAEVELVGGHALPGGGVAVAGTQRRNGGFSAAAFVAHYSPGGTLDHDFAGGRGEAVADFDGAQEASSVSWGEDGSVVVGGISTEGTPGCGAAGLCADVPVVVRFAPDGSIDRGFGEGGESRFTSLAGSGPVSTRDAGVLSIVPDGGGRYLVAGGGGAGTTTAFLAALGTSGLLDPGFGEGGVATVRREMPSAQEGGPLAVTNDGRILVAAHSDVGIASSRAGVIGYLPDGRIDGDFGTGGFVPVPEAGSEPAIAATDGGAVLVSRTAVFRVDADGAIDRGFGALGMATPLDSIGGLSPGAHLNAVDPLPDGRIVAAGTTNGTFSPGSKMLIVRLLADGRLDPSFGDRGVVELGCRHSARCQASALAARFDGKVVIAATSVGEGKKRSFHVVLAQLGRSGALDRRFGARGFAFLPSSDRATAPVLALAGRRALVAGSDEFRPNLAFLARYDGSGHPDPGFGKRGSVSIPRSLSPSAVLPVGGRIVLVGSGAPTAIAYRWDGARDRSFRTFAPTARLGATGAIQGGAAILAWTGSRKGGNHALQGQVRLARLEG